jgi:phenylacetate-coenzyme A ligase PaaK-like adenylate-forming protein
MGDSDLLEAGRQLLAFRPSWVLGYSVALDQFARVNAERRAEFHKLGLKAVVATAESFPRPDSSRWVSDVFGCPVIMEYGAVETGPIAHERPEGGYAVVWHRHLVEMLPSDRPDRAGEILVTSLEPRCLLLIRYRLGDLIVPDPAGAEVRTSFAAVIGRCNDTIVLPGGHQVHSEVVAHVLRATPVTGFQLVQKSAADLTLRYMCPRPPTDAEITQIRGRLGRVHVALASIRMERVERLEQTVAGKTKVVCRVG